MGSGRSCRERGDAGAFPVAHLRVLGVDTRVDGICAEAERGRIGTCDRADADERRALRRFNAAVINPCRVLGVLLVERDEARRVAARDLGLVEVDALPIQGVYRVDRVQAGGIAHRKEHPFKPSMAAILRVAVTEHDEARGIGTLQRHDCVAADSAMIGMGNKAAGSSQAERLCDFPGQPGTNHEACL